MKEQPLSCTCTFVFPFLFSGSNKIARTKLATHLLLLQKLSSYLINSEELPFKFRVANLSKKKFRIVKL
jgi:hypothetical protein